MKSFLFYFGTLGCLTLLATVPRVRAEATVEDEQTLLEAGLSGDGPCLLAFFRARACVEVERERLRGLLRQFRDGPKEERDEATMELLGLGPLALPLLRQTAGDLDHPDIAERASRCLPWLEGPSSSRLLMAAARSLARRKPEGAAGALLAYLPFASDADVIAAVNDALLGVAAPNGKPDVDLLRGLADPLAVRRAAAGIALCRAAPPDRVPAVRKLLKDPAAGVRLRAALALAEAHDAEAVPVLIDLLAELDAEKRRPVEEFLTQLAGEWAPLINSPSDDKIARKIRRDSWAAWWQNTNGEALLEALREHTPTDQTRQRVRDLLSRLGSDDFGKREAASHELFALGRVALPQLREAQKDKDAEVSRRAKQLVERIEREPAHQLPLAALRLLGIRKPAGAAGAVLSFLPYAEDESQTEEARTVLASLAAREGKLEPDLVSGLSDSRPLVRAAAAQALAAGGGAEGRTAARKLLRDESATVRLRAALALAQGRERDSIAVLIDLLTELPAEEVGQVEDVLYQLAGETAPAESPGEGAEERKKYRDAWAAWWKVNAKRADLSQLTTRAWYGYTLICDAGRNRVYEIDRHGKERWAINNVVGPFDAVVVPGNRVLIAEFNNQRITERDFKGNLLWQKHVPGHPSNVQRLPNGHTLVSTNGGPIVEYDRAGKEVYTIPNVPGNTLAAARTRQGAIACLTFNGQCLLLDTSGKQLKSFATNHDANSIGGIDLLPNGHILISRQAQGKVAEYDREGKALLELDAPGVRTATALPNGHILVASQSTARVYEMDRAGKIVWEHKNPGNAFRARRR